MRGHHVVHRYDEHMLRSSDWVAEVVLRIVLVELEGLGHEIGRDGHVIRRFITAEESRELDWQSLFVRRGFKCLGLARPVVRREGLDNIHSDVLGF